MYWIGVDHHKRNTFVTSLHPDGTLYRRRNLAADPGTLTAFFAQHPRPFTIGIEATYAWEYVADIVEGLGEQVRVGHPLLLKAFARRHKKNDKIDSQLCAWLLCRGDFPAIVHPTPLARQQRDLYRQRMDLVARRTSASARAKAQADRLGFQAEMNLSTLAGIAELAALSPGPSRAAVWTSHVALLTFLYHEIARLEKAIDQVAEVTPEVQWLMSVPGLGAYLSLLIASEVFDATRFGRAAAFAAYAGTAPGVAASGGKVYAGHLVPSVNRYLRWAFCEAAGHYVRACPRAKAKYDRLLRAKGWKTARLAIARQISIVAYRLLREQRPYRPDSGAAAADTDDTATTATTTATAASRAKLSGAPGGR